MSTFSVSTFFQTLPFQQQLMARFELASYLSTQGEQELAKVVCNAATPEGLAPHLSAVDKVIKIDDPDAVFRSSRIFSPTGGLVHGPVQQIERPLEERQTMLASLGGEIRIRNPKGTDSEGAALADAIEGVLNDDAVKNDRPHIEVLITESQGYMAGLAGDSLDDETLQGLLRRSEDVADPAMYGARLFIDAIRAKYIPKQGRIISKHQWLSDAFLDGALDVWDRRVSKGKVPLFMEITARYWARANRAPYTDAGSYYSREMGRGFGRFMLPRMKLGLVAGLPKTNLINAIHLLDVEMFIYGRGWLKGYADRSVASGEWAEVIRDNLSSIISQSVSKRDAGYMADVVTSLPDMLQTIDNEMTRLKAAGNFEELKAIRANRRSIISRALNGGKLGDYVDRALEAVPDIIKEIDDAIERFKMKGNSEAAEVILANRGLLISCALNYGTLKKYVSKSVNAVPNIIMAIDDAVDKLRAMDQLEASKTIESNRRNIVSLILKVAEVEKGVNRLVAAVPEMIRAIDDGVAKLKGAGAVEAAETILANRGSIISRAISAGAYKMYINKMLKAAPKIISLIDAEAARFEKSGQMDASRTIIANRASIVYYAFNVGKPESYVKMALKAAPDILRAIEDGAANFREAGKPELSTIILTNRNSIVNNAFGSGLLEEYVNRAIDAVPDMLPLIREGAERLKGRGEPAAAKAFYDNRGHIIHRALDRGGLKEYIDRAQRAMPGMLQAIDDGVARFDAEDKTDELKAILKYRETIIYRALSSGGLESYIRKALESAPDMPWLNGDDKTT
jgi:uncharacterized spore protein YtfJ